jgi:hypothetical protein
MCSTSLSRGVWLAATSSSMQCAVPRGGFALLGARRLPAAALHARVIRAQRGFGSGAGGRRGTVYAMAARDGVTVQAPLLPPDLPSYGERAHPKRCETPAGNKLPVAVCAGDP